MKERNHAHAHLAPRRLRPHRGPRTAPRGPSCRDGRAHRPLVRTRTLVSAEGLRPSSEGRRLRIGSGKLIESDGPFTEAKEVIGGFFIIGTDTKAQAIEHTRELLDLHTRVLGDDFVLECELRQLEDAPE
ncbi:MAG: transcriptional regulator [Deltaproteobacteria bacterium]|nr:transcriptional regulator [Nannocystaceae bacterium]